MFDSKRSLAVIGGAFALACGAVAFSPTAAQAQVNCTGVAAWSGNSVAYAIGNLVTYSGSEYKCIQAHTSEAGWDPPAVASLWTLVGACATTTGTTTGSTTGTCSATPSAPATPTASGTTSTSTNLSWSAVTPPANCTISSYEVYKNGTALASTSSTSYSVTGLTASTTYKFTVAAVDSDGTGAQSAAVSVTTSSSTTGTTTGSTTGSGCWAAWVSTTAYSGGAQVSYSGVNYTAAFWSQGSTPSTNSGPSGSGEPWIPAGSCSTGSTTGSTTSATTGTTTGSTTGSTTGTTTGSTTGSGTTGGGTSPVNALIGYWDNWGTITLPNMNTNYKVLLYSFAEGSGTDGASIYMYTPSATNPLSNAASDIKTAQGQGRQVMLSIGGANSANITLQNSSDVSTFVSSVENLVSTYGFNGIDLDLENSSMTVNSGDSLTSPSTPDEMYMGQALQQLHSHFGSKFLISLVPETADIDAYGTYGGIWGSYLPVIQANKSIISFVSEQDYDSGSMYAANGSIVSEGTADFEVAMAELLCHSYAISGGQTWSALSATQVALGNLVGTDTPSVAVSAYNYLDKGTADGGSYKLLGGPYGSLAGIMVWDANTDAADGYPWASGVSGAGVN